MNLGRVGILFLQQSIIMLPAFYACISYAGLYRSLRHSKKKKCLKFLLLPCVLHDK